MNWLRLALATDFRSDRIEMDTTKPSHYWLAAGTSAVLPVTPISGLANLPRGNNGWFEYEFSVPTTGWWSLAVDARAVQVP